MAKVLVVDDESGFRGPLGSALRMRGHDVRLAASGEEAIEIGEGYRPDVAIVDWMLRNRLNGGEVAELLHQANPDTKAIIITGYLSVAEALNQLPSCVNVVMEKPFRLQSLLETVDQVLTGRQASGVREP